jgi:hypothetical protein
VPPAQVIDDAKILKILTLLMQRVELEKKVQDCIDRGFVPAAAIRPDKCRRRVLVVVDVGAGTSDFGAFVTVPGDGSGRLAS